MNENFFGKYSVFCVFGSVVGCVVVPLIAQVLQQQSMECMILSAIVITLTAAHLKKGGNESSHSKLLYREYEKKRSSHYNNSNKKHKSISTNTNHSHHSNNNGSQIYSTYQNYQQEEYMQQHEHLRKVELEKRNEEKRLRKLKKREERLKIKEEETKKQKELDEKYKALKEKRKKQQKENIQRSGNNPYHNNAFTNYDKYLQTDDVVTRSRRKGLNVVDENCRTKRSTFYDSKYSNTARQHIPRFNNNGYSQARDQCPRKSSVTEVLSINCSNLSASCSSLSSIDSSGSSSPPPPTSPKPAMNSPSPPAWKSPILVSDCSTSRTKTCSPDKSTDFRIHKEQHTAWLLGANGMTASIQQPDRALKSYSNFRPVKSKVSYNFDSSSLFCSNQGDDTRKNPDFETSNNNGTSPGGQLSHTGREYSLFGSHQFGSSFLKTPII